MFDALRIDTKKLITLQLNKGIISMHHPKQTHLFQDLLPRRHVGLRCLSAFYRADLWRLSCIIISLPTTFLQLADQMLDEQWAYLFTG